MHIRVDDGVAIFATYFLRAQIDRSDQGVSQKLAPFQCETDGIVIYPDNNLIDVENILKELNIPYTLEPIIHDQLHKTKSEGCKYCSRSEAIAHFINDTEPESQVIPNLRKKLAEKDTKIASLEDKFLKFEQRLMKGGL